MFLLCNLHALGLAVLQWVRIVSTNESWKLKQYTMIPSKAAVWHPKGYRNRGHFSKEPTVAWINRLQVHFPAVHCWVSTWMWVDKPSRHVTGLLGQLSHPFGVGKSSTSLSGWG